MTIKIKKDGEFLFIGESPQLVVNLSTQENYIKTDLKCIPYKREVVFSEDLLEGKREKVLKTAVRYYYEHACNIVQAIQVAEEFKQKMNITEREKKKGRGIL